MFTYKVINNPNSLSTIQTVWQNLSDEDPNATLFNSYEWMTTWINCYWEPSYELHVVVFYDNNIPIAIFPSYQQKEKQIGLLLGSGEPEYCEVSSEYLDMLVGSKIKDKAEFYHCISSYIARLPVRYFRIFNCIEGSHIHQIAELSKNTLALLSGKEYKLQLDREFSEIHSEFSKNLKKKSKEITNRFEKDRTLSFTPPTAEDHDAKWSILKKLHTDIWKSRGAVGAMTSKRFSAFHKQMDVDHPNFRQCFSTLTYKGRVIAINHYYMADKQYYFYLSGMDASSFGALSPGTLLHILSIRSLSNQDLAYNFMKGSLSDSYKEKFCKSRRSFYTVTFFKKSMVGYIDYLAHKLANIIRKR